MPSESTGPAALRHLSPAALEYARQLTAGVTAALRAAYEQQHPHARVQGQGDAHLAARQFVEAHFADLADALETEVRRRNEEMEESDDPNR